MQSSNDQSITSLTQSMAHASISVMSLHPDLLNMRDIIIRLKAMGIKRFVIVSLAMSFATFDKCIQWYNVNGMKPCRTAEADRHVDYIDNLLNNYTTEQQDYALARDITNISITI